MKKVFLKTDGTEKPPTRVIYNRLAAAWRMGIVHPFEFCVNVYSGHDTEIPRVMFRITSTDDYIRSICPEVLDPEYGLIHAYDFYNEYPPLDPNTFHEFQDKSGE